MRFDYDYYFSVNVLMPICLIILAGFILFRGAIPVLFDAIRDPESRFINLLRLGVASIAVIAFLVMGGRPLVQGGFKLLSDKELVTLSLVGEVECIEPCDPYSGHVYKLECGSSDGYWITIDRVRYHLMSINGLQVGDTIHIEFLPHSRFVVLVELANDH